MTLWLCIICKMCMRAMQCCDLDVGALGCRGSVLRTAMLFRDGWKQRSGKPLPAPNPMACRDEGCWL